MLPMKNKRNSEDAGLPGLNQRGEHDVAKLRRWERQRGMGRGGGGEVWRTARGGSKGAGEVESKRVSAFQVLNSDLRISLYVFRSQSVSLSHSLCIKVQSCVSSDL